MTKLYFVHEWRSLLFDEMQFDWIPNKREAISCCSESNFAEKWQAERTALCVLVPHHTEDDREVAGVQSSCARRNQS